MQNSLYEIVRKARQIIAHIQKEESAVNKEGEDILWEKIANSLDKSVRAKRLRRFSLYAGVSVAACICIVVSYIFLFAPYQQQEVTIDYLALKPVSEPEVSEIILSLSEEEQVTIKDESDVVYNKSGEISIDSTKIIKKTVAQKSKVNTIFVPKGRSTKLKLEDGSTMHINSGSLVMFPVPFGKNKREIFVEGEIFIEVKKDTNVPFVVITPTFEICVSGTSFNVSTYKDTNESSVVLAEGAIEVSFADNSHANVKMKPGYQLIINDGKPEKLRQVNVGDHISWINRMLLYRGEKLSSVFNKLRLYYGVEFVYDPYTTGNLLLNGKLDVKEELEKMLDNISIATRTKYKISNNQVFIEPR